MILVTEQALGSDQGQKFVYVVNEKKEAIYRPVKVGRLYDGLRVIESGLKKTDKVVVIGLQRIQPGTVVEPKVAEMPMRSHATKVTAMNSTAPTSPATNAPGTSATSTPTAGKAERGRPAAN